MRCLLLVRTFLISEDTGRACCLGTVGCIVATLNNKWGKTGGPRSFEDKVALWTITVTGTVVGWIYYQVGMYVGLSCLWVAPWLGVGALVWSSR